MLSKTVLRKFWQLSNVSVIQFFFLFSVAVSSFGSKIQRWNSNVVLHPLRETQTCGEKKNRGEAEE